METILMSRKERRRLEVLSRVGEGSLTLVQASELLGISYRQMKRLWARYQQERDAGLPHRLRGRASNRQSDARVKSHALAGRQGRPKHPCQGRSAAMAIIPRACLKRFMAKERSGARAAAEVRK